MNTGSTWEDGLACMSYDALTVVLITPGPLGCDAVSIGRQLRFGGTCCACFQGSPKQHASSKHCSLFNS